MRDLLTPTGTIALWALFFATSVYGHVALRLAVQTGNGGVRSALAGALTFWGWTALLSWCLSGGLWLIVLSKHRLLQANSISSLRYVLICLAASFLLREPVGPSQWAGMALIGAGIALVAR